MPGLPGLRELSTASHACADDGSAPGLRTGAAQPGSADNARTSPEATLRARWAMRRKISIPTTPSITPLRYRFSAVCTPGGNSRP